MPSLFIIFQHIAPQHLFSRIVGRAAESKLFRKPFISWFKKRYQVDLSEALIEDPFEFENFNAFFTRALKPEARTICKDSGAIVSPADGAISQLGAIDELTIVQAKGRHYSVESLLACSPEEAKVFVNGSFATIYLSPRDYHRVHMPIAGKLRKTTYVPGKLFSVNQKTAESVADLFARNERLVCYFDTAIGPMALVLVGAMIVAGIETVWSGGVAPNANKTIVNEEGFDSVDLNIGEEMGRFKLGSTAILLFQENAISLSPQLKAGSAIRMGESIATQNIEGNHK
ncbi:MAG: phosphatidylserine decarboxylase [Pseudohongiellaceae bacterium]|jgi:phosphatidylserine decarboxylase